MLKDYYPYEYMENIYVIDYKKLYKLGYRGIIFDIDNTLAPFGMPGDEKLDELFKRIQKIGFKTFLLTDNSEERVKVLIRDKIKTDYICEAGKPNPKSYLEALTKMNLTNDKVVYIGDQLTLDILGANRAHIPNILVKYIGYKETKKIGKRRKLENMILAIYKHQKKYNNRIGDILVSKEDEE